MTVDKCKILKLLDMKMARLKFDIKALYDGKSIKTNFWDIKKSKDKKK